MANSISKGKSGEREAAIILTGIIAPVYRHLDVPLPELKRNLTQARSGGYDLVGLEWLALEVKRRESNEIGTWWSQAIAQAGENQEPVLMWRQSRKPWRFRVLARVEIGNGSINGFFTQKLPLDMEMEAFALWLQRQVYCRLKKLI